MSIKLLDNHDCSGGLDHLLVSVSGVSASWCNICLMQCLSTTDMETLEILDLEGNEVDDLGSLAYLKWCPQLAVVTLADNPIATEHSYQAEVSW